MLARQEDKDHQDHQKKYQDKNQDKYQETTNHHQYNNHQRQNNWLKLFRQWNKEFSN